jgi:hypothetical protein
LPNFTTHFNTVTSTGSNLGPKTNSKFEHNSCHYA